MEKQPRKQRIGYAVVHFVEKARKDHFDASGELLVKKGQSYYWWKWAWRNRTISLKKPTPEQLDLYPYTVSKAWSELQSNCQNAIDCEEYDSDLLQELEEFRDERQTAYDNLSEYFPEHPSLEEMQNVLDEIDEMVSELENLEENED